MANYVGRNYNFRRVYASAHYPDPDSLSLLYPESAITKLLP